MDSINAVFISSDSKRAYMATDNTIEVINLEEPTVPRRIKSISTGYMDALAIIVTKDRKRMYVNSEKNLKIYDIEDDNMSFIHSHEIAGDGHYDEIENLTLSDDDNTLYATCSDEGVEPNNSLVVFDISDKDKLNLKKKIAAPRDIALTYDAHNQSLSTDGKKFYTLTTWFYVMNLDIL
jgi:WD40 repeat protein